MLAISIDDLVASASNVAAGVSLVVSHSVSDIVLKPSAGSETRPKL